MKTIILFAFFYLITSISFAQCSVQMSNASDGSTYYMTKNESIYKNEDLENGILSIFAQLIVIQSSQNMDLFKYGIVIKVAVKDKPMIIPRKIVIIFKDNTFLQLIAETKNEPEYINDIKIESSTFRMVLADYTNIRTKAISSIKIIDTQSNSSIIANPYEKLLFEQANCINDKLKK